MELKKTLTGESRNAILNDYATLQNIMGEAGASETTAKLIYKYLSTQ
jgi:hypothetical protein